MSTPARNALSTRESSGKKLLSIVVLALLVFAPVWSPVEAQILKAGPQGGPQKLFINILEGEGALNNIRQRDAREPVVQVTDENHKPVAGAAVLFLIHNGPHATATFNGGQTLSTTTGPDGIAHATGLQLGTTPGSFTISVTASLSVAAVAGAVATTIVATAIIHQANVITALSSSTAGSSASGTSASSGSSASGSSTGGSSAGGSSTGGSSAGGSSAGGTSAGGTGAGGSAGSTAGTVASHGILHLSHTALIVAGSVVVAATVATVVAVTHGNSSTSLTLGSSTVGHP
jgi:hypothetical protein